MDNSSQYLLLNRTVIHKALFYGFNFKRHEPVGPLLRSIDRSVAIPARLAFGLAHDAAGGGVDVDPDHAPILHIFKAIGFAA